MPSEVRQAHAVRVEVTEDSLIVDFADGRTVMAPLSWYPRLVHGNLEERANWRLIGRGEGIHWPALDEDVDVDDLLAGRRSGESPHSLARWLAGREQAG